MLSKACEYGIKAIIYIGMRSIKGRRTKMGEIVEHIGAPEAFTAKILGTLAKHQIVDSLTGPTGGFAIDIETMKATKVSTIIFILDGDSLYKRCILGLSECDSDQPCPMHKKFAKVRKKLKDILGSTNIYQLATGVKLGRTILYR